MIQPNEGNTQPEARGCRRVLRCREKQRSTLLFLEVKPNVKAPVMTPSFRNTTCHVPFHWTALGCSSSAISPHRYSTTFIRCPFNCIRPCPSNTCRCSIHIHEFASLYIASTVEPLYPYALVQLGNMWSASGEIQCEAQLLDRRALFTAVQSWASGLERLSAITVGNRLTIDMWPHFKKHELSL